MIAESRLARAFLESQPLHAAMTLEQLPVSQASAVLGTVPHRIAATVLRDVNVPFAAECLAHLITAPSVKDAAAIIDLLSLDEAAGIVRALDAEPREQLLAALSGSARDALVAILPYDSGTAGAVMDSSVFRLAEDVKVADARTRLARAARALLHYVYVVDREQHLVGVLDIPELLAASARDTVSAHMHRNPQRISVFMPVALVREHAGWHSYHALPVVDDEDRLLGAIRYQTLRRLERESAQRGAEPSRLTAGALAELFQLGTTGLVSGIAATAADARERDVVRTPFTSTAVETEDRDAQ